MESFCKPFTILNITQLEKYSSQLTDFQIALEHANGTFQMDIYDGNLRMEIYENIQILKAKVTKQQIIDQNSLCLLRKHEKKMFSFYKKIRAF